MKRSIAVVMVLGAMVLPAAAVVGQAAQSGYLPSGAFDILAVLPPAPVKGEVRYDADRRIFKRTRALLNTPRGALATNDVDYSPPAMLRDFSCAVGVALTPENAPKTTALIARAGVDTANQSRVAKDYYKRLRPYQIDRGRTCQNPEELKHSFDYPSGHTTRGWTWAAILAQVAPDRATPIMARGRAYGESRIICGVHNASAVEAGRVTSAATLTAVATQPAFQADLAAARAEMDALRADPATPRPAACEEEAKLVAQFVR
ncbi:acid phosphatase [Sphingomonas flavalba]|uniref:acid phosphatase n=1 Tax=Sphingomonas flavalba TaxID=2559804 RepID=UPI00109DFBD6|nr:phosphatase PAP2 family protein [Sphingomonas flavalba]